MIVSFLHHSGFCRAEGQLTSIGFRFQPRVNQCRRTGGSDPSEGVRAKAERRARACLRRSYCSRILSISCSNVSADWAPISLLTCSPERSNSTNDG